MSELMAIGDVMSGEEFNNFINTLPGEFGKKTREARQRREKLIEEIGQEEYNRREAEKQRAQLEFEERQAAQKRSLRLLEKSGFGESIEEVREFMKTYSFITFTRNDEFQKRMFELAQKFIRQAEYKFFALTGAPGCGKTHLGTAISGHYLNAGKNTLYEIFGSLMNRLKSMLNDEEYGDEIYRLSCAEVLYIDDFMKPVKDEYGKVKPPTGADIRISFELINLRTVKKRITIITSERSLDDVIGIDEALGSRIKQQCGEFALNIDKKEGRNYRLR
jgi:DNA replication protein DnaC